ncbi:MAG TPA: hypothetical protein PKD78_07220, partial [Saprospiraceae bacterium]|nr:hypothetical protein [Saprospiraceae bacterium]
MRSRTLLLTFGLLLQAAAMLAQLASPCAPQRFLKTFGLPTIQEMGLSISPAPQGGVYTAGLANDRALISRLDSLGQTLWSRSIGLDTAKQLRLFEMITDSEGMIVAVGLEAEGLFAVGTASIAFRYDPAADQVLWMKRIESGIPLNCGILERALGGNYVFYQTLLPNDTTLLTQVEILELQRGSGDVVPAKSEIISRSTPILFSNLVRWKESLYAVGAQQLATATGGT